MLQLHLNNPIKTGNKVPIHTIIGTLLQIAKELTLLYGSGFDRAVMAWDILFNLSHANQGETFFTKTLLISC